MIIQVLDDQYKIRHISDMFGFSDTHVKGLKGPELGTINFLAHLCICTIG